MEAQPQRTETDSLDVTEGVIWRQLVMLLWPVFVASFVQQAYQLVNTFVVGRFASTVALGGMQATQSITELAVGFSVGVGAGCAVIVGQSFGARHGGLQHTGCGGMEQGRTHPPPHEHGGTTGRGQF